jgi:O-antigen ligase
MIALDAPRPRILPLPAPLLRGSAVLVLSLLGAAVAIIGGQYALAAAGFLALLLLAIWQPRYGLYLFFALTLVFEPVHNDRFMLPGYLTQSNINTSMHISFVPFTPAELLLIALVGTVAARALAQRRALRGNQLAGPIYLFLALLILSVAYGTIRGGSLTIALWETRTLISGLVLALIVPELLAERRHVETLFNVLIVGEIALALDLIWRRHTVLVHATSAELVAAYAHDTPIVMNTVVMLLVARLVWPATRRQRLAALAVPLLLYAESVTERRAGWAGLYIALLVLVLLIARYRRRLLIWGVLPLALLFCGYLTVFWNSNGTLAQPARAIRSISNPDQRDLSSDNYRILEAFDIRINIKSAPVVGLGFGRPFTFYVPLPDLSFWPFWHYITHNGVLWVWMKMGPAGFIAFLALIAATITRGTQLMRRAATMPAAPALTALIAAVIMALTFAYVDVSLTSIRICALLGLAIGVIGAWGKSPALIGESRAR